MPKDRTENIDRYKVRGGQPNEFELDRNEGAVAEEERRHALGQSQEGESLLRGGAEPGLPQNVAERIREVTEAAREKVERRRRLREARDKPPHAAARKGGAKKAAKKAAGKSAKKAVKGTAKKSATKKGPASKKAAGKSGAAAKGGGGKSSKKASARKGSAGRGR